jgi:hypothetical protein
MIHNTRAIRAIHSTIALFRVCLDGEGISVRIALFGLVDENSVRLVICREI